MFKKNSVDRVCVDLFLEKYGNWKTETSFVFEAISLLLVQLDSTLTLEVLRPSSLTSHVHRLVSANICWRKLSLPLGHYKFLLFQATPI